jgi:hypothetical protein
MTNCSRANWDKRILKYPALGSTGVNSLFPMGTKVIENKETKQTNLKKKKTGHELTDVNAG